MVRKGRQYWFFYVALNMKTAVIPAYAYTLNGSHPVDEQLIARVRNRTP